MSEQAAPNQQITIDQAVSMYMQQAQVAKAKAAEYDMGAQIIQALINENKALKDLLEKNNIPLTPPVPAPENVTPMTPPTK